MRILLTGGTGFIGTQVIKKLLALEQQVAIMSRNPKLSDPNLSGRVKVITGDMRQFSDVMKAVSLSRTETIIHLAYALTADGEADPYWAIQVNVLGTNNFFEAARLAGVRRVVLCSSIAAYSPELVHAERPVTEDEKSLNALSIYGRTKTLNEFMANKFETKYGVEIPAVRISAVYGSGREARGITAWTSQMVAAAVQDKSVEIPLRPDQQANFIYVDDCAEQLVRLSMADNLNHRLYNSGGVTASTGDLAAFVKKYYPNADIRFESNAPKWPYPHLIDGGRLEKDIGFKVRSVEHGLLEQINLERKSHGMSLLEL